MWGHFLIPTTLQNYRPVLSERSRECPAVGGDSERQTAGVQLDFPSATTTSELAGCPGDL